MQELLVDFITSLDGYGGAKGWPGWWGLEGPEYLSWLGELPERSYTNVEIRDKTEVYTMQVREVSDPAERQRLWGLAVEAYPPYQEYQNKTDRLIPVLVAEPVA